MNTKKRSFVLSLAPFFCVVTAFPQASVPADPANQLADQAMRLTHEERILATLTFPLSESAPGPAAQSQRTQNSSISNPQASLTTPPGNPAGSSVTRTPYVSQHPAQLPDTNRDIYYRNKLEFSLDVGWLPINIPFPFDFMMGDSYNTYPLKYTLVPIIASLRWHMNGIGGRWFYRGNWDMICSGAVVAIPRGPETRYFAYMMGVRRNFVQRNWKFAPYVDGRAGLGNIDAKGPLGIPYAQGQDFTFTLNLGSGFRYNFNNRYSLSAGLNWMHISNANMSQGKPPNWGIRNYGINVYGPMFGLDVRLGKPHRSDGQVK